MWSLSTWFPLPGSQRPGLGRQCDSAASAGFVGTAVLPVPVRGPDRHRQDDQHDDQAGIVSGISIVSVVKSSGHWLSSAIIGCHRRSLAVIGDHWLSSAIIGCHWRSLAVIGDHWLSSAIIGCHRLSLAIIIIHRNHTLSYVIPR
jgi:hypothetical protein